MAEEKKVDALAEKAEREMAEELRVRQAELDGSDEFVVVVPYVTMKVKDAAGGFIITGMNEGAVVEKENVEPDSLRHHVETGLVRAKDSDAARFAGPAGTPKPGEPPNVAVTEQPVETLPFDERQRRQQAAANEADKTARTARARQSVKDS